MNTSTFKLPRLYHRPSGGDGRGAAGEMEGFSTGLTRAHWDEFQRLAPLLPPSQEENPDGALGLFRGQTVDFILAHAFIDATGKAGVHYVPLTAESLRQAAGRVRLLQDLMMASIPPATQRNLPPLDWTISPPTLEEQADDLSAFIYMMKDNFKVIAALLGALIQGIPIVVLHAPGDLNVQMGLIQGLLALLPIPARFGVTFATSMPRLDPMPVQIAFTAGEDTPENVLRYDWESGELTGPMPEEDLYSRITIQQLRLDPIVAVEQMVGLTKAAGWRLTRQDPLVQALGWAARRMSLDAAVTEGQPADMDMVASVLAEDPTLSDDLRVRYVRHLLAFALALDNPGPADVIAPLARLYEDVETAALAMLDEAIHEGKSHLVYRILASWLADPLGPEGSQWQRRAYTAASAYLQTLVAVRNTEAVIAFFSELQEAPDRLMISEAAPDLLESALPLANESSDLAQMLFLLAVDHLPAAPFQRLARMKEFTRQLPAPVRDGLEHFHPGQPTPAPAGMLVQMADAFGDTWNLVVLARLIEWITALERPDLIDTPTLSRLVELARSPWRGRYEVVLRHVVQDFSQPALLALVEEPGPRYLAEILLLLGDYRQVVTLLERISTTRFRGDDQAQFGPWVSAVFEQTSLDTPQLLAALEALPRYDLKLGPCAMAYRGALVNKNFDPALEPVVDRLAEVLNNDPLLVIPVGYEVALRLVQVYARRQEAEPAVSLAAVITNSLDGREEGLPIVGRLWTLLNWNQELREAALELFRRYVRQVPQERARTIPDQVGRKLGARVGEMLQATVILNIMADGAGFEGLSEQVRVVAALLADMQAAYQKKPYPTLHRLRSDLDGMTGGVGEPERRQIAANLLAIGQIILTLGGARSKNRNRALHDQKLLAGSETPRAALDALLWIGGNLAGGQSIQPNVDREAMHHFLGRRSVNALYDESNTTRRFLQTLIAAFPPEKPPALTLAAFHAEVESLWKGMRLYDQRRLKEDFAADAQAVAVLITRIAAEADDKALSDSGLGRSLETAKREPRSALEAIRFVYGYFERRF